jgi:hypothetical protein
MIAEESSCAPAALISIAGARVIAAQLSAPRRRSEALFTSGRAAGQLRGRFHDRKKELRFSVFSSSLGLSQQSSSSAFGG